jgi:hypothetical protein
MCALENALTNMRLIDEAGGSIVFTKNGILQADPIALPSREKGCVFFPAILLQGGQGGAACTVNFGGSAFRFSPPPGYSALQLSDALYSNSDREAYLTGSFRRTPLVTVYSNTLLFCTSYNRRLSGSSGGAYAGAGRADLRVHLRLVQARPVSLAHLPAARRSGRQQEVG